MKKMIDQEKINKSDALFEGMTADANGNVTVGKNLEVDGKVVINTVDNLETKDGSGFTKKRVSLKKDKNLTDEDIKNLKDDLFFKLSGEHGAYYMPAIPFQTHLGYEVQAIKFDFAQELHIRRESLYWDADKHYSNNDEKDFVIFADYTKRRIGITDLSRNIVVYGYIINELNNTATSKVLECENGYMSWTELPKYFNHDVQIMFNNSPLFLSIITSSNTPIDSITDLKTACGSRTRIRMSGGFAGTGSVIQFACAYLPQENKLQLYSGNTTTVGGTTVLLATGDGNTLGAITDDITKL